MNIGLQAGLYLLRNAPVVLDSALAARLGVEVPALRAAAADAARFPEELVFRLSEEERKELPAGAELAFSEAGVALLLPALPQAPVLEALRELARAREAWLDLARVARRVEHLEAQLRAIGEELKAAADDEEKEKEPAPAEHHLGFVEDEPGPGLKARQRAARKT